MAFCNKRIKETKKKHKMPLSGVGGGETIAACVGIGVIVRMHACLYTYRHSMQDFTVSPSFVCSLCLFWTGLHPE